MKIVKFTFNPIQENTYLIYDESKEAIIIDAGCYFDDEKETLRSHIERNKLTVKRVINTHLHFDHHFGNKFLFDNYGISPEAHKKDEFLLEGFCEQASAFGFKNVGEAQPLGRYIEDGEKILFGNSELEAIFAPGHSPGHLAFYCKKEGVLFAGDVIFKHSIGRTDLAGGSHSTLINSIKERILPLPDTTLVYSGHGVETSIGEERKNNPFF